MWHNDCEHQEGMMLQFHSFDGQNTGTERQAERWRWRQCRMCRRSLSTAMCAVLFAMVLGCSTQPQASPESEPEQSPGALAYIQAGDLWVRQLPAGPPQRLDSAEAIRAPRWSPSGAWLAYRKGDQVWVARSSGTDARAVADGVSVAAFVWSPVADMLAYTTADGRLHVLTVADGHDQVIRAATGAPLWSPDGQWLAFAHNRVTRQAAPDQPPAFSASLWRARADGSDMHELVTDTLVPGTDDPDVPLGAGALLAGWAGEYMLFWPSFSANSLMADGTALRAMPVDGARPRELVPWMLSRPAFLDVAPAGGELVVTAGGDRLTWTNKQLVLIDPAGGSLTPLTSDDVAAITPTWSPDGRRIAYTAGPAGEEAAAAGGEQARQVLAGRRIWVIERDGSNQRQVTGDPNYRDERPRWVGENHLLFARLDERDTVSLWIVERDGSNLTRIVTDVGPVETPSDAVWFGFYGYVDWDNLFDVAAGVTLAQPATHSEQ